VSDEVRPHAGAPVTAHGSVVIRRARPDVAVSVIAIVILAATAAVGRPWVAWFAGIAAVQEVASCVFWLVHRPCTVIGSDGITTSLWDLPWRTIEQMVVIETAKGRRVRVTKREITTKIYLPAPALRPGDGGAAMEAFDAGVSGWSFTRWWGWWQLRSRPTPTATSDRRHGLRGDG